MKEDEEHKLLIRSAAQIVQVVRNGERVVKGNAFNNVAVLDRTPCSKGVSIIVAKDGTILDFATDEEILEKYKHDSFHNIIDAHGKCVLPGLVDAHTHPVWSGDRVKEFSMKLAGFSYMDIHKIGGGINYTVEQTKLAPEKELKDLLKERLREMLKCGTTLVEAKSGYGLETDTEMKLLRVIEQAKKECPIEISSTFCGAHSVPKHLTSQEATNAVLDEQIPALKRLMDAGELTIDSIDVFCEKGVFDLEQSRQILQAGRDIGLRMNFHGDELHPMDAAKMGGELKAEAISHVEKISDEGIKALAESGTVAVVLPTTAYMLRLDPPPIQKMIEAGVPIALGSDFNPNAFCYSMPIAMNLACLLYKMTMEQALNAATLNAAAALGRSHTHGSIERGKVADFVIANASRWEHIIYQLGAHDSLIHQVIKNGEVVHENPNSAKLI